MSHRTCSVCGSQAVAKGLCDLHYRRLRRTGDPLKSGDIRGVAPRFFREAVLEYHGEDCLIWPYGTKNGYAMVRIDGKRQVASRLACIHRHGSPPTPKHQAAHKCGRGSSGCVNPDHLYWATALENSADKIKHGTTNRGERSGSAKLTESAVVAIRQAKGLVRPRRLAADYGVSRETISNIHHGRSWKHLVTTINGRIVRDTPEQGALK